MKEDQKRNIRGIISVVIVVVVDGEVLFIAIMVTITFAQPSPTAVEGAAQVMRATTATLQVAPPRDTQQSVVQNSTDECGGQPVGKIKSRK